MDAQACDCKPGYVCKLSGGVTSCVPGGGAVDAGTDVTATADASPDAFIGDAATGRTDASGEAGRTTDAAEASAPETGTVAEAGPPDAAEASAPPAPSCNADGDCVTGSRCIDGACTPEGSLCSDGTQCVVAGSACVDGICEPHCSATSPCAAGYQCDFVRGVCNENPSPCSGSGTSSCLGGSTCVEGHCVAPCATGDGAVACPGGQLCIHGGCVPDQAATFTCKNDGNAGSLATTCDGTDICLHHDCYVACDPDAGAAACADPAEACIEVTVTAGTYLVCAAPTTMGSDCDLAVGKACASGVCVDGFCQ
jgi:hypothetical protein